MSEVLRSPWLLQTVLDDLSNDPTAESGLNHLHRTPKLVQIIQFMSSGSNATHMLAHLSDKFHYIVSLFSDQSLGNFAKSHPSWSILDIQGGIIRILEYRIVKIPCSGDSEIGDSIVLVIEEFEHVGSDGSAAFGDPRYVHCNPAVRASLQRPAPPSPSKKELSQSLASQFNGFTFTQSLDPSDLLFLESTCTQTFQRQSRAFPQSITDLDWKIPADQSKILSGIKLMEIAEFEYGKSDVELSESEEGFSPKKIKFMDTDNVIFPETQSNESQQYSFSQSNTLLTQQPFTQARSGPLTQFTVFSVPDIDSSTTQTLPLSNPVVFPETQAITQNIDSLILQSSPLRNVKSPSRNVVIVESPLARDAIDSKLNNSYQNMSPSSPINSPIKRNVNSFTDSPVKPATVEESVLEYPDYSSW